MNTIANNNGQQCIIHDVSGSITVMNGRADIYRQIRSNSKWFDCEYYIIEDNSIDCLLIRKCGLDIPKNAQKAKRGHFHFESELPIGHFEFDREESTEDELVIYYR